MGAAIGVVQKIPEPVNVKHFQQKEKVMPIVNSVMPRRLIIVLALVGLAVLSPVIAARWAHTDAGTTATIEIRQDSTIPAEPVKFEYFPAQFQNQSQNISPEPHIQAF